MHNIKLLRQRLVTAALGITLTAAAALYVQNPAASPAFAQVSGHTIVVDAGHGGFDGGAVGASGALEAGINLAVARNLRDILTANGASVIMTRDDDNGLAGTKRSDMEKRRSIIDQEGVELVVSIHMNKFTDPKVNGPQVFHMPGSQSGEKLAKLILSELNLATGKNKREIHSENFFMLRNTKAPSVIVECGFMSNPAEEALLLDPKYQQKLAEAIAKAIESYYAAP